MARHTIKAWTIATRPWSFTASGLTVLVVLAYLDWSVGSIDWINGLWAIAAIILFHAAGNTWSDYHDYMKGIDAADTYSVDTLTSGAFKPHEIRNFSLCLLVMALIAGGTLILRAGIGLIWIGLGGLICTLLYPMMKARAMGDVVILMAYGLLPALGTSYVATGQFHWSVMWVALPVALLVDSILHANNTRDMLTDRRASIKTLPHLLGVRRSVVLYILEMTIPFMWIAVLCLFGILPLCSLITLILVPVAIRNSQTMQRYKTESDAEAIASLDQRSAQLQLMYCVLMSLTLMADLWLR